MYRLPSDKGGKWSYQLDNINLVRDRYFGNEPCLKF
jgi:hypothetical protein